MSYPGNSSLSSDVQQRILSTFEQTLGLATEGSRQEALLGCDFVLRLDPQFEPARRLQERLKNGRGTVQVDDLRAAIAIASTAVPSEMFASLDGFDLPDLPRDPDALRSELRALLDQHRLNDLMNRAHQETAAVTADPELRRIVEGAQERLEAEPYVLKFVNSAREALRKGDHAEVTRLVDKAKSLNPSHPDLAELERATAPANAANAANAANIANTAMNPLQESSDFSLSFDSPSLSFDSPSLGFDSPSIDLGGMGGVGGLGGGAAGGSGDSETDRRIRELLDEGQAALNSADPQAAIDAWSRIFLIDIDNQEAARRIEQARKLKAESERQVEEIFHDGLGRLEDSDLEGARQAFRRVLQVQPGHLAAREYLSQLDAGIVPTLRPAQADFTAGVTPGSVLSMPSDLDGDDRDLKEEILVPPDPNEMGGRPAERREPSSPKVAMSRKSGPSRAFLMVGAAVLALVLAGGWFAWQNWSAWFPNSAAGDIADDTASPQNAPALPSPIDRATALHKAGKTPIAIAQLRRIPPSDRHYAAAQTLIKEWEGADAPAPAAGPAPEVVARRQGLLQEAQQAYQERSYLLAVERFNQAAALGKLEGTDAEALASAKTQLEPLNRFVDLYKQGEWEMILRDLWQMREADPNNRDVTRLIVNSYYNMGVRDLQRSDTDKALKNFEEALEIAPADHLLRRHYLFAQTYAERPKDLLYRIYVKYLPFRA